MDYDELKQGDLVTSFWLERETRGGGLIIEKPSIGKEYSLKPRPDLNAQDHYVRNIGQSDNSMVFEVVKLFENTITDVIYNGIDDGKAFFNSKVLSIPANQTVNWVIETGNKDAHLKFKIASNEGAIYFSTYEGITANEDGTLQTILNNDRSSNNVSTLKMRLEPTGIVIDDSIMIREDRLGASGTPSQRSGGSATDGGKLILKNNTKYLLRTQNLINSTNNVSLTHVWYEI